MNSFNCGEGEARTVSANRERVVRTARAKPKPRGQSPSREGEARAHTRQSPSREGEARDTVIMGALRRR